MREHPALHLVHDITEPDALLRVGKTETSTGPGMAERRGRWTQERADFAAVPIQRIHHEARREGHLALQNRIEALGEPGGHPPQSFLFEQSPAFPGALTRQHGIEFRQGVRGGDTSHRGQ